MPEKSLLTLAIEKKVDVSIIKELIENEKHEKGEVARLAYLHAFTEFQNDLPEIKRSGRSSIEGREYPFSKIEDITASIKKKALEFGFSYRWRDKVESGAITVTCYFMHDSGHYEENTISADTATGEDKTRQNNGTIAILRKHTLTGVAGITSVDEDTDGAPATEAATEAPTYMSDSEFKECFPKWEILILDKGRNPAQLIAFVEKRTPLSEGQIEAINKIQELEND